MDGTIVTNYGTDYDWKSITHYDLDEYDYCFKSIVFINMFSFLVDGKEGNVIEPNDKSITSAGGTEMTKIDREKLGKVSKKKR